MRNVFRFPIIQRQIRLTAKVNNFCFDSFMQRTRWWNDNCLFENIFIKGLQIVWTSIIKSNGLWSKWMLWASIGCFVVFCVHFRSMACCFWAYGRMSNVTAHYLTQRTHAPHFAMDAQRFASHCCSIGQFSCHCETPSFSSIFYSFC